MANAEQLSMLRQGVEVWNGWRAKNMYVYADLNEADLQGVVLGGADLRIAHLRRANLFRADLSNANLSGVDLSDANLREANLNHTDLTKANLNGASLTSAFAREANLNQANLLAANLRSANFRNANFQGANLVVADLEGADLSGANLSTTNFTNADLSGIRLRQADLSGAKLTRTNLTQSILMEAKFIEADLNGANFSHVSMGNTIFVQANLSKVIGLALVDHHSPSHISIDTIVLSEGKIPDAFLRGCGLSDADIEHTKLSDPSLGIDEIDKILYKIHQSRAAQARQISPLFISYSDADSRFVDKVGNRLDQKGIRFWRDRRDLKMRGMEAYLSRTNSQTPTVLLILSKHSWQSDWVEQEVRTARELEQQIGRAVLHPIALDYSWKEGRGSKKIMEQIPESKVLDFSAWKNDGKLEGMFHKLIDRLELFYKG